MPYDEYRQGRFYQEWLRPQGWVDAAYVVLEKSGRIVRFSSAVIPSKASGMVDDEMRRRMALIAPHARRALLIGKSMDLKQSEAATFADTLNGLSAGIFLVDASGRIVHANAAGQDMLYASDLSALNRRPTRRLAIRRSIRPCKEVFAAAAKGDTGIGAKAIALPLIAHDGERYVAHVLPLTSGARRATGVDLHGRRRRVCAQGGAGKPSRSRRADL